MKTYPTTINVPTVGAGSQNPASSLFETLVNQEPRKTEFQQMLEKPRRPPKRSSGFGKRIPTDPSWEAARAEARGVMRYAVMALRRLPVLTVAELILDHYLRQRESLGWPTVIVPSAWSIETVCDPIHGTVYKAGTNACSLLQAWPQTSDMPGNFVNRMIFLRGYTGPGGFTFGKVTHVYTRPTPGVIARDRPQFVGSWPRRRIVETMLPALQPINQPVGVPVPVPWQMIPARPANDMPQGREEGNKEPSPSPARKQWRGHARTPRLFPVGKFGNVTVKAPSDYKWEKPISREYSKPTLPEMSKVITKTETKERKYKYNRIMGIIWQLIGKGTEVLDYEDVLFDALDSKERSIWLREYKKKHGHGPNPIEKARYIFRNWDKIDWEKAAYGFASNEIEDRVLGEFGKRIAKANKLHQRPIGYQAGGAL